MEIVEILDNDNLFRRVPMYNPNCIKPDGSATSFAFKTKRNEDGLSVDLEKLTTVEKSILDSSKFALFSINVGYVRQVEPDKMDIEYNPTDDNLAHCLIVPAVNDKNTSKLKLGAERVG
jgi:hypothetical protein